MFAAARSYRPQHAGAPGRRNHGPRGPSADSSSRWPPASSISAGKRRPRTSAPTRASAPLIAAMYMASLGRHRAQGAGRAQLRQGEYLKRRCSGPGATPALRRPRPSTNSWSRFPAVSSRTTGGCWNRRSSPGWRWARYYPELAGMLSAVRHRDGGQGGDGRPGQGGDGMNEHARDQRTDPQRTPALGEGQKGPPRHFPARGAMCRAALPWPLTSRARARIFPISARSTWSATTPGSRSGITGWIPACIPSAPAP